MGARPQWIHLHPDLAIADIRRLPGDCPRRGHDSKRSRNLPLVPRCRGVFKSTHAVPLTARRRRVVTALDFRLLSHRLRQPVHYLFVLPPIVVALVLWGATPGSEVGSAGQRLLPRLLASLGVGLAVAYHQVRALCLSVLVAGVFAIAQGDVAHYLQQGQITTDTPLRLHALST